jgi:acyl-coenzyme A thioesterase PaaI-like protein
MSDAAPDVLNPFTSPDIKPPLDDTWAAKRELSDAIRQLTETLVTSTSDAATLRAAAASLRAQTDALNRAPRILGRKAFEQAENGRYGTWRSLSYELSPMDGKCNPIAAPLVTWVEGDTGHGRATLGWAYEGPPGTVHGGFVCALFDHFLGIAQIMTGQPGVTGAINVRFHLPTPLNTELELIGRVKEVRGRRNIMTGEIRANGQLTASCEAMFIHVSGERFLQLRDAP